MGKREDLSFGEVPRRTCRKLRESWMVLKISYRTVLLPVAFLHYKRGARRTETLQPSVVSERPARRGVHATERVTAVNGPYVGPHVGPLAVAILAVRALEAPDEPAALVPGVPPQVAQPLVAAVTVRAMVHPRRRICGIGRISRQLVGGSLGRTRDSWHWHTVLRHDSG